MADEKKKSDLETAVDDLGKLATGLAGKLFGPKLVGKDKLDPDQPVLSPEADRAIDQVGENIGRLLHAAGEGLKKRPLDPVQALGEAEQAARAEELPPPPEGWSELSGGLKNLAEGFGSVAEGVLDVVAPRKPKAEPPPESDDATG